MGWLGKPQGIFRLYDSDDFCGSFIPIEDAAIILDVSLHDLSSLPLKQIMGQGCLDELVLHKAWASGGISSPHLPRYGNATRSLDEVILMKLLEITLPGCEIAVQIPWGKKHVDLKVTHNGLQRFIEFLGPSHFISQYKQFLTSPLTRKREIEDHFGIACVIWPFWIQRCSKSIRAIFDQSVTGLASVWSTKALFGDFAYPDSATIITEITDQFRAIRQDGIGYMYGNEHTRKPIHPIVVSILRRKASRQKLIPRGNRHPDSFWLPNELK